VKEEVKVDEGDHDSRPDLAEVFLDSAVDTHKVNKYECFNKCLQLQMKVLQMLNLMIDMSCK